MLGVGVDDHIYIGVYISVGSGFDIAVGAGVDDGYDVGVIMVRYGVVAGCGNVGVGGTVGGYVGVDGDLDVDAGVGLMCISCVV